MTVDDRNARDPQTIVATQPKLHWANHRYLATSITF
jgi:hypothetical protein